MSTLLASPEHLERIGHLAKLDRLAENRTEWARTDRPLHLSCTVGAMDLLVLDTEVGPCWCIKEAGSDEFIQEWTSSSSVVDAMRTCTDFARAWLQANYR